MLVVVRFAVPVPAALHPSDTAAPAAGPGAQPRDRSGGEAGRRAGDELDVDPGDEPAGDPGDASAGSRGDASAGGRRDEPGGTSTTMTSRARAALAAFAGRPGYRWGVLGRSTDEPDVWTLTMRWDSVGAYRRALSSWDVRLHAHPLLYEAVDEPTAFEVLLEVDSDGVAVEHASDRAPTPATGR